MESAPEPPAQKEELEIPLISEVNTSTATDGQAIKGGAEVDQIAQVGIACTTVEGSSSGGASEICLDGVATITKLDETSRHEGKSAAGTDHVVTIAHSDGVERGREDQSVSTLGEANDFSGATSSETKLVSAFIRLQGGHTAGAVELNGVSTVTQVDVEARL